MKKSYYRFLLIPFACLFLTNKKIEPLSPAPVDIVNICVTLGGAAMTAATVGTILKNKHRATLVLIGAGLPLEAAGVITYGFLQYKYHWDITVIDLQFLPLISLTLFDIVSFAFIFYYYRTYYRQARNGRAGGIPS